MNKENKENEGKFAEYLMYVFAGISTKENKPAPSTMKSTLKAGNYDRARRVMGRAFTMWRGRPIAVAVMVQEKSAISPTTRSMTKYIRQYLSSGQKVTHWVGLPDIPADFVEPIKPTFSQGWKGL